MPLRKPDQKRFTWEQINCITNHFQGKVNTKKVPSKDDVLEFLQNQPSDSGLKDFSVRQIQLKVKHLGAKHGKNVTKTVPKTDKKTKTMKKKEKKTNTEKKKKSDRVKNPKEMD